MISYYSRYFSLGAKAGICWGEMRRYMKRIAFHRGRQGQRLNDDAKGRKLNCHSLEYIEN